MPQAKQSPQNHVRSVMSLTSVHCPPDSAGASSITCPFLLHLLTCLTIPRPLQGRTMSAPPGTADTKEGRPMPTHSPKDKLQRRAKTLAAAKARLRAALRAQAAGAVQNRAESSTGGQGRPAAGQ